MARCTRRRWGFMARAAACCRQPCAFVGRGAARNPRAAAARGDGSRSCGCGTTGRASAGAGAGTNGRIPRLLRRDRRCGSGSSPPPDAPAVQVARASSTALPLRRSFCRQDPRAHADRATSARRAQPHEAKAGPIDRRRLNAGRRADYDSARRFLAQAEDAVKENNLMLAESSVEKAETLADGLK